jgi:hypothetical protein
MRKVYVLAYEDYEDIWLEDKEGNTLIFDNYEQIHEYLNTHQDLVSDDLLALETYEVE